MKTTAIKNEPISFRPNAKLRARLEKELKHPMYNEKMSNVLAYALTRGLDILEKENGKTK